MSPFGLHPILLVVLSQVAPAPAASEVRALPENASPAAVKKAFLTLLDRPKVPLDVHAQPVTTDETTGFVHEQLTFASEKKGDGSVERVPTLIVRPAGSGQRRPAVIVLHGTGGKKDGLTEWLDNLAKRGFVAVAIDARYHGDRAGGKGGSAAYVEAITKAWRSRSAEPPEHPFYYDTCWDIWRTLDYLATRDDVDPKRIALFGISMGGIETWLAGAVDDRVAVAIPAISVQSFSWSLLNDAWQGRANTIKAAHEAAAADLGQERVNSYVCRELWNKVIPGILGPFDCPSMIRLFAGRPLMVVNGEKDLNCPIGGAKVAIEAAEKAFKDAGATEKLRVIVAPGVGHSINPFQRAEIFSWLTYWLKP